MSNCGVCNQDLPLDRKQIGRHEDDGSITPYHIHSEYEANKLKPCEDCGLHRAFCNDCAEPEDIQ